MFQQLFENVRRSRPLIHNITNYVTVNDCANMLLACGASPVMADELEDAVEITGICDALNINIGTLNDRTIPAMYVAGKRARQLGHPIVLDPAGAGASAMRTDTARGLLHEVGPDVVRGNISEIRAVSGENASTRGVDVSEADQAGENNLDAAAAFVKSFAKRMGTITVVTGPVDIVSDGEKTFLVRNGQPEMSLVTGTGCQLSAVIAAFLAANPEAQLQAAAAAVCAMGLCGEIGYRRMSDEDGNATYRNYIIDAMYRLTPETLEKGALYEVR